MHLGVVGTLTDAEDLHARPGRCKSTSRYSNYEPCAVVMGNYRLGAAYVTGDMWLAVETRANNGHAHRAANNCVAHHSTDVEWLRNGRGRRRSRSGRKDHC